MTYNIAIDADSIVYKACYRNLNTVGKVNLEIAYAEFWQEIGKILDSIFVQKSADGTIYKGLFEYQKGDELNYLIVFSPSKSFRNEISPKGMRFNEKGKDLGYKANRKPGPIPTEAIKGLKRLILTRADTLIYRDNITGEPGGKPEADDVVNYFARQGWMVAAIDKDVINANPTSTFDYNNKQWHNPRSEHQIEQWYLLQTLIGDSTDNVAGAPGIGKKTAETIMQDLNHNATFADIVQYFETEADAVINHMLVRMDRFDGEKIIPWSY